MSNNNHEPGFGFYLILTLILMACVSPICYKLTINTWNLGANEYTGEPISVASKMIFIICFPFFFQFVAPIAATLLTALVLSPATNNIGQVLGRFLKR